MGGNVLELTTGEIINHSNLATQRGGAMTNNSETASASRFSIGNVQSFNFLGFRVTLFL
jgi:hypothetical protein